MFSRSFSFIPFCNMFVLHWRLNFVLLLFRYVLLFVYFSQIALSNVGPALWLMSVGLHLGKSSISSTQATTNQMAHYISQLPHLTTPQLPHLLPCSVMMRFIWCPANDGESFINEEVTDRFRALDLGDTTVYHFELALIGKDWAFQEI